MSSNIAIRDATTAVVEGLKAGCFIGGEWRDGASERAISITVAVDGSELRSFPGASTGDVDEAYEAAALAQREWASVPPGERAMVVARAAEILERRRSEITSLLRIEAGSSALKANIEVSSAIGITREAATFPNRSHGTIQPSAFPGKENRVYREPRGVIGVISPWNFPLHLSIRSVSPALALGNAVVLKPASDTTVSGGLIVAEIFEEAGLPAGLLSVVAGAGSEIGDRIVQHPVPSMISFTGSTPVGQRVGALAAQGYMKHVALELGGNAPLVVLDDADLDGAVNGALMAKFLHQGQICMAANRVIVDAKVYDEFVEKFAARVSELVVGDTTDESVLLGPIINDAQTSSVVQLIDSARRQGAREVYGGHVDGRTVGPHVFADVTEDMQIAVEEIFGPVIGIIKAENEDSALKMANNTEFGLSSAVFTRDIERGVRFARSVKAGMTHVNDSTVNDEPNIMFGGEKNSGIGRFNGDQAIDDFTTLHWIGVRSAMGPVPF
ncbi:aldehyde dehydrogenase family protein [Nesterenkonia sp. E16_7]|uniref:aldehyde dehydrogenase family protein n=1 Tax=unclassified Nesterenkonia TaxID=2629769 RepID=UPI001A92AA1D|nr:MULTISPECIES: aldehyde dehydrogenase family protein [unclassified Nesterenkonia]MBO0594955.1 aldehyde dehydrogenase family protein [Nesterenkonia sp. E16_10]MBO0598610.1 aldehyde dehydrogenase family protein [Nesterenkonia sp. E16_7]